MRIVWSDHSYVAPRANIKIGPPRKEGEGTEGLLAMRPTEFVYKMGYENVKLPTHRTGLPGNVLSFYIVPLDPAYKAGLTGHVPVNHLFKLDKHT